MVKHIVMWKLKEEAHGNPKAVNARLIKEKLEALNGKIPGLIHLEVGINFIGNAANYDVVLYSEFGSAVDLQNYQVHPEHQAIIPFINAARLERQAVDYEV
ncbi:MAG TPA: Dabb family protein [Bacillota bacterium]